MKDNFNLVGEKLNEEFELVSTIRNEIIKIGDDTVNIAAALEENAAYFEEISAIAGIQNNI